VNDRAHELAERLADLSRQREQGLITEWEYHEASRLLLEGSDGESPEPETSRYHPSDHAYATSARKRSRVWLRLGVAVVLFAGAAAAVWLFLLRGDDAAGAAPASTTTAAAPGAGGSGISGTTIPEGDDQVTTTTTTLAPQLFEFADTVLAHRSAAATIRADAESANALWEERSATYAATHEEFIRIAAEAGALVEEAAGYEPPTGYVRDYQLTINVLEELADAADGLVDGLEASDDGTRRRAALEALILADRAHDASVTALLTMMGIEDLPQPAL
jgi:hypothetical protein